eukprot:scaffold33635_cov246-Skeletonema_menzelii.AAC.1
MQQRFGTKTKRIFWRRVEALPPKRQLAKDSCNSWQRSDNLRHDRAWEECKVEVITLDDRHNNNIDYLRRVTDVKAIGVSTLICLFVVVGSSFELRRGTNDESSEEEDYRSLHIHRFHANLAPQRE